jgi:hypothetical protein
MVVMIVMVVMPRKHIISCPHTPPPRWQGDKDSRDMGLASHYEENLVAFIKAIRAKFNAKVCRIYTTKFATQN